MALNNIYLLKFNNYFNRRVKKLGSAGDYIAQAVFATRNTAFNYNDGVQAEQVINSEVGCDYAVVTDPSDTVIVSRWFVMESQRLRNGQVRLSLYRDVIADYYDKVIDSPCYIEKATLQPNDPFIFNPEGNGFNQIKTSETLLKDQFKIPWLIGYYNLGGDAPTEITATTNLVIDDSKCAKIYTSMEAFHTDFPEQTYYFHQDDFNVLAKFNGPGNSGSSYDTTIPLRYKYKLGAVSVNPHSIPAEGKYKLVVNNNKMGYPTAENIAPLFTTDVCKTLTDQLDAITYTAQSKELSDLDNQYIKIGSDYYVVEINTEYVNINTPLPLNGSAYLTLKNLFTPDKADWVDSNPQEPFSYSARLLSLTYKISKASATSITVTLNSNKRALTDQPWRMFAIPYGDIKIYYQKDAGMWYDNNKQLALNIATELAKSTSAVYDVQILPYVINNGFWADTSASGGWLWADKGEEGKDFDYVGTKDNPQTIIWYPTTSSFRNTIKLDNPVVITEPKIQNECDMYRLVGPNYSGGFEFSAAKNGGISQFEVNCTYLPVSPYIHINPTFGGLYGRDFDDARGLICQGNFSISTVSDAWKNYVIQNKNFNEMFNRELENMEVSRSIQKKQELANVITGTLGGAVSGGAGGALVGNGIGAAIGGIVGGTASLAGGLADMKFSQQLYDESKSFKKDMRDYSLGNIRALPQTLSKTSAYNIDNKYFPFLEYYTCTDKEKQALRDQIKYTGMTVMRTGKISEFLQEDYSYVQGKMILLEEINDDTHLSTTIADEIMKGVYIK
mgnify:CR=1 FL=1